MKTITSKILVVDDEPNVIKMLSDLLTSWGYQIKSADTTQKALDMFKHEGFDLVIADIHMPNMDGLEFMKRLNTQGRRCSFVFLTGDTTQETALKALEAGADDYLIKPVNSREFKIRIERCLKHHTHIERLPVLIGANWALIISIPLWLVLGYIVAKFIIK